MAILIGWPALHLGAQSTQNTDNQNGTLIFKMKTAYLYNIAKFVTWEDGDDKVVLCIAESSPLYRFAVELENKPVSSDRILNIRQLTAPLCHIVFDDRPFNHNIQSQFQNSDWSPTTLTISDRDDALADGYSMQLFLEGTHLRFAINSDALADAEYRISSKLLRLSRDRK